MILMILKTKETGGSKQGSHWAFLSTHAAALITHQSPSPVSCCLLVSFRRLNREASWLPFLSCTAHIGLASVSRQVSSHFPHRRRRKCNTAPTITVSSQVMGFVWSLPRRMTPPSQRLEVAAFQHGLDVFAKASQARAQHHEPRSNAFVRVFRLPHHVASSGYSPRCLPRHDPRKPARTALPRGAIGRDLMSGPNKAW